MVKTEAALMTLEQHMQRYSDEGPFEVIEGEVVPVTPQITRSGRIAVRLLRALADHTDAHHLGEAFMDVPFVLMHDSNWVKGSRVPDVMFATAARLAQLAENDPAWEDKPLMLVPDLVAEIVSPTDHFSDVEQKIARYLADGVRVVWLIEPEGQTVTIYTPGSQQLTRLSATDRLTGGDVIPGFEVPVSRLFTAES
jgi:Uma2 family endonuclease